MKTYKQNRPILFRFKCLRNCHDNKNKDTLIDCTCALTQFRAVMKQHFPIFNSLSIWCLHIGVWSVRKVNFLRLKKNTFGICDVTLWRENTFCFVNLELIILVFDEKILFSNKFTMKSISVPLSLLTHNHKFLKVKNLHLINLSVFF